MSGSPRASPRPVVDLPRLDAERIEKILADPTTWLTPEAVEEYDPDDFEFLASPEKGQLDEAVRRLVEVASQVPDNTPATPDQIHQARPAFRQILEILHPDRYNDPDAFVAGKKIEAIVRPKLPDWVRELVFETDFDSSGSPAIWIWAEVEDEVADEEGFHAKFHPIRETLRKAASRACPERWPFVRLRSVSEQRPEKRVARR